MDQLVNFGGLKAEALQILHLVRAYLTSVAFLWQTTAIVLTGLAAILLGPRLRRFLVRMPPGAKFAAMRRQTSIIASAIAVSGLWFVLAWTTYTSASSAGLATNLVRIAVNLLGAWVVIRAVTRIVRNPILSNAVFLLAWGFAALNILGLLGPILHSLNALGFTFGNTKVTGLTVFKGIVALILLLWAAMAMSRFLSDRIRTFAQLTPTLQILLSKITQFLLIGLAVIFALQVMGIPLTAFAIFGGAVGIGVGLGLQKAASNVIGGIMLLMDQSIRPGDVLSVGDTFGWVTSLGGRYVGIRTRDGIEHLIPNEVFITNGVENWTHTERAVRIKVPFGVSYGADPHQVIELALAAAGACERVLKSPNSVCLLTGFGDSSVNLELRVWINDPQNGVSNVKSDIYLMLWDRLKAAGIEIPFPQRDLRIKSPVTVELSRQSPAESVR
jgi:small-conductance mechanosensitive channel